MFNEIRSTCKSYYESYRNQIPNDTWETVAKSATYSFMVNMLVVRGKRPAALYNLARPLVATSISAIASAIYGLTVPLFHKIFNTRSEDRLYLHHEFIKITVVNVLTSALLAYVTAAKVNLFAFEWLPMIPFNLCISALEIAPTFMERLGDNAMAQTMRIELRKWGVNACAGSGSIFLTV